MFGRVCERGRQREEKTPYSAVDVAKSNALSVQSPALLKLSTAHKVRKTAIPIRLSYSLGKLLTITKSTEGIYQPDHQKHVSAQLLNSYY